MIRCYTSDCYLGPRQDFLFRTLLQAHGDIGGERYVFAEFVDEVETPPGTVPAKFVDRARAAFRKTEQLLAAGSEPRRSLDEFIAHLCSGEPKTAADDLRAAAEIKGLLEVSLRAETLRHLMHMRGYEGDDECRAHFSLVDALHEAGMPCRCSGIQRVTKEGTD